jgi:subtilisin family serine protease
MVRNFISVLFFVYSAFLFGQSSFEYMFRVYLSDKGDHPFLVAEPEKFLSERSIERKLRQNVAIDSLDFPVSKGYLDSIEKEGGKIVAKSKWFNTCVVQFADSVSVDRIKSLPFVDSVKYVWRGQVSDRFDWMRPRLQRIRCEDEPDFHNYFGFTEEQFKVHNAEEMIKAGFRGKGMHVGVVDAGFTNCDVIPYFEGINLFGYRDFVPGGNIFSANDHGTKVLSTMAVNQPNLMMGSAPEANYWLFRSEDSKTEFPVEEDFWVAAVEYADSVGVDLVNTSLGYNEFDDKTLSYSHFQLDGQTALMTSAANKAFEKGMLVIGSAGNERKKNWRKITVPADAENLLAIGAIRIDSLIAPFSSTGPTADGRIKPDLVSVGSGAITIGSDGTIGMTNGTSLSSPFMAGLIASLWSINPSLNRKELVDIVKKSSSRYAHPDTIYGYGIPDFGKAVKDVLKTLDAFDKKMMTRHLAIVPDQSGKNYLLTLFDPVFRNDSYRVGMLDEDGIRIADAPFDENNSVMFYLPEKVRKENKFIHFVIDTPLDQYIVRIKL